MKLDISFLSFHYETVDVIIHVYQDNVLILHSIQNNWIYWAIQYGEEKEVESLINDSKTDVNWTNEDFLFVSVIL